MRFLYSSSLCQLIVGLLFCAMAYAQTTVPQWRSSSSLPEPLALHRSVLLHTGEVLVCGGVNQAGTATTTSLLYSAGSWKQTANTLRTPRFDHALVAVRNSRGESVVFAIGGYSGSASTYNSTASVEVLSFNSAAKTWSWQNIGSLPTSVGGCAAAADKKGSIIVSGGRTLTNGLITSGTPSLLSARIDINALTIQRIGDMATPRSEHAVLMLNGPRGDSTVLSACGESTNLPATEILAANVWDARANPPAMQHLRCSAVSDLAEVARMIGGNDATGVPTNKGEWYDTKSGWRAMPRMQTARSRSALCLVAGTKDTSKNYLIVGGQSTPSSTPTCEIFSMPNSGSPNGAWSPFNSMVTAAADRCLAIDEDNLPLVSGGNSGSVSQPLAISACEIFQPLSANDLSFGQEEVGRESARTVVSFRNTWQLPVMLCNLRIPGSAEFRLTNARDSIIIAPGGSVDIDVRFRPGSIGATSALLLANVGTLVDTVKLQGEGIKSSITILSKSVDFGSRLLLSDSTICFSAIRNDGKDTTVIDSVIVSPSNEFTVISPIGRTRVAPDSSMIVCVKYHPQLRQSSTASAEVHIADRSYPIAVIGQGLRRFVKCSQQASCDTVAVAPGSTLPYVLVLSNTSDKSVHIDSTIIKTSLAGTFQLASPSPFPLDLIPGATTSLSINFQPQREAQEQGSIQFVNNGDTLCAVTLCFIPRNRSVNIDIPQSAALRLCEGDSIRIPVILENPGNFDALHLDSVYVKNMSARIAGFSPLTLAPRENTSVDITLIPNATGLQQAQVFVQSNQGQSQTSIPITVLPSMKFRMDNAASSIGSQLTLKVYRDDQLNSVSTTALNLQYNGSMLSPRALQNVASKNFLDLSQSSISNSFGSSVLNLRWNSHPTQSEEVFEVVCDVLRGNDFTSTLQLQSSNASSVCIQEATALLSIDPECGGRSGLINATKAVSMMSFPSPVIDEVQVKISCSDYEGLSLRLLGLHGEQLRTCAALQNQSIDCSGLAAGVYICQLLHNGIPVLHQTITLLH